MAAVLTRRPLLALACGLALVAGACGGADGPPEIGAGVTTTLAGNGDPGARTPSGEGATRTTRKPSGGGGAGEGDGRPRNADDADVGAAAKGTPGEFAGMLLAPSPAAALVLDVLVQPGVTAAEEATSAIRQILAAASGKPVSVRGPVAIDASGDTHSAEEIRALADDEGRSQGNGVGVVHVVYLRGSFTDDSALGVAVRGDTFAIFPDEIASATSPLVSRARVERAVVTHELGHVLGLVDLYLNTGRDDPEHPGHSTNSRSVMFWAVESDLVGQVLGGPPPVDFDAADLADLKTIREGAAPSR